MRRASKILTLILVVVFLFGIFAGCDLVGKDVAKYRKATALTVGNQNVTVGKLVDTFNTYSNNYYYYILYNGWTVDNILDLAIQSLVSQYMRVDDYVTHHNEVNPAPKNAADFVNAKYLQDYQLDYSISYVKYLLFTSLDKTVMEKVEAKYELNDEEADDKSRDFYEYDNLKGAATYAEYYRDQNFQNEDMTEYISKYWTDAETKFASSNLDELEDLYLASAEKMVEALNKRLDEDVEKISVDEYTKYQKSVIKQYETSIKNNYGIDFKEFVALQINDMITSGIINLYNYEVYKEIESEPADMKKTLEENYNILRDAQKAKFALDEGFETYIESLNSESFIYDVPSDYNEKYVFVKNILIPFSAKQSAKLASLKADLGTDKDEGGLYVKYRNSLAAQVVADDFNSTKDKDGKYDKIENLFTLDGEGNVIINSAAENDALKALSGGNVAGESKEERDAAIKDLMARFNTDVGQHSSLYSYVVRVGDKVSDGGKIPDSYTHRWVQEFVDATNDAMEKGGAGHYGIGISDYGVHIVYVEGYVKADVIDFNSSDFNYLDPASTAYRLFKTYFEERQSKLLTEAVDALQKDYANKVTESSMFKKFLKENGLSYDLDAALKKNED